MFLFINFKGNVYVDVTIYLSKLMLYLLQYNNRSFWVST